MTKPTITNEDRALAEFLIGGTFTEADADEIAAYRQAAFNAGLERAAVIASKEAQGWLNIGTSKAASNMTAAKYKARHQAGGEIVAKIRAEKEKLQ